jgi:hypothetical protein
MRKDGGTQLLPRAALLIRGSKPDLRSVRIGASDHQSQGRRGHAHSSLSSSPLARGRPTCRVREPVRAASPGDLTEGELPHPRSLANGTEPHLANPRKRFNGRVSGPRAYPYQTGHGRPLEPPASSSTRNPQSATRSMGVAETSPSVPRRDGEGTFRTRRRVHPDRLEWTQARGARCAATPPGMRRTRMVPVACASPKPVETSLMPVETGTTPTGKIPRENPCRSTHAPAGLRGLDPRVH